ncbi:MAG: hypothetical protein IT363_07275 [Methanoregulaceae archaeon]|nr:hypothetical protein [Methanoregulaceae archaeon]
MSKPYKGGSTRESLFWFFMIVLGLAGQILTMYLLHPYQDQLQAWILLFACLPFFIAVIIAIVVSGRIRKRRLKDIAAALVPFGLETVPDPPDSIRNYVVPHIEGMQRVFDLRNGVAGIQWMAYNPQMLLFEHQHVTGSGKHTVTHTYTVIAWAKPDQVTNWMVAIRPRLGETRMSNRQFGEDVILGDDEFDDKWLVYGSADTAHRFLSLEVRPTLMSSPKGERWYIDNGWVVVGYPAEFRAENLVKFFEHARTIARV